MAHGTPERPEDIEPFYTRIRRGSPPSAEQLADLERRYAAIGGTSPLTERTGAQVAGIAAALERSAPGRFVVRYGAKYTEPSIEQSAAALVGDGVDRIVGLVLTPHRSTMGSGEYLRRAAAAVSGAEAPGAAPGPGPRFVPVEQWYDVPAFIELMAARLTATLGAVSPEQRQATVVLFTAHSLPQRVVTEGDPYPEQMADSAARIAAAAGLAEWGVAWQSAGRTPEPWIGPDILEVLAGLPDQGARAVVVCPVGFVADHLEVLFDLDIEAQQVASAAGLTLTRTGSLNDDPGFVAVLADVVRSAAEGGS